jgi:hypothetical protein
VALCGSWVVWDPPKWTFPIETPSVPGPLKGRCMPAVEARAAGMGGAVALIEVPCRRVQHIWNGHDSTL